jgi:hypothetical protein
LWRAVRRSDGEETLSIFIGGEKAAVKAIDVGHKLLRKKDSRTQSARGGGKKSGVKPPHSKKQRRPGDTGTPRLKQSEREKS